MEAAKVKLLDDSANFLDDGMALSHAPAPLPYRDISLAAPFLR